jgi:hypothetical protein
MKSDALYRRVRRAVPLACLLLGLAVMLMGCQSQGPSLGKAAETLKVELQAEMNKLIAALTEPAAQENWQAVQPILQAAYEEMQKKGKVVPAALLVMDKNGIAQDRFPPKNVGKMDFMSYEPAQTVYQNKKKAQAMFYLGGAKIFVLIAPILQGDQVAGAVAMGFPDEALKSWKVSEQDFLNINFNQ